MTVFNPWALLPAQLKTQLPPALMASISEECMAVEKLSAGLSNQNYHLKMIQQDWVLRDNKDVQQWCDRDNEVICWRMVESLALAPKLIWQSDTKQFYLSEFIEQTKFDWASTFAEFGFNRPARPQKNIYEHSLTNLDNSVEPLEPVCHLLSLLNQLSSLPLPPKKITITAQWQVYLSSLTEISHLQNNQQWLEAFVQLNDYQPIMATWLAELESCVVKPQFCHRDLSPFNLLLNSDKLHCIDFEYCAASHPMFDLASILATHQLTEQQAMQLSQQYLFEHPNLKPNAIDYLAQIIDCFWMFGAAWALMMAAETHVMLIDDNTSAVKSSTKNNNSHDLAKSKQADAKNSYFILFNKYLSLIS